MSAKQERYGGVRSVRQKSGVGCFIQRDRLSTILVLILATVAVLSVSRPALAQGVFGSKEIISDRLGAFTKWTDMLARLETAAGDHAVQSGECKPNPRFLCWRAEELALIEKFADASVPDQLEAVNRFVNRAIYVEDLQNWGVGDHWATPDEFYRRAGDCEDFSIAKYMLLKRLGVPAGDMRVVVLEDLNLGVHHAVLSVDYQGTYYILDNQISVVIADSAVVHYRPIYSINEEHWWLHLNESGQPLYSAVQP